MRLMSLFTVLLFLGSAALNAQPVIPRLDPPAQAGPLREGPPVGFVTHPLMGAEKGNVKAMADVPATAELSNLFCWAMTRDYTENDEINIEDLQVDLKRGEEWLREIYRTGRRGYPILDTSITHSEIPWRAAMTRREGQSIVDAVGQVRTWSSFHSPIFRQSVYHYIDQIIDWVKVNDPEGRIPGYFDGAEWFWHYCTYDFSPLAIKAFHPWLEKRYGSLEELNRAWGSQFTSWDQAEPPRNIPVGEYYNGCGTNSLGGQCWGEWASPIYSVTPGQDLTASVQVATQDVLDGMAILGLQWLDAQGKELGADPYGLEPEQKGQGTIAFQSTVPMPLKERPTPVAGVRLRVRLHGPGKAVFTDPKLVDALTGQALEVAADQTPAPGNAGWTCNKEKVITEQFEMAQGKPVFTLKGATPSLPYEHAGVAFEDWTIYSYESMAGWLNETTAHIKQRDPQRQVASYVGWGFAMMSQWEGANQVQRVDTSLANTPNIDVNGIQMAIAGEEFEPATFLVDMARKYNKPIWATDLVDFPYGLFSGYTPIYRGSQAAVQHGLDGFFYYNWWGTADYSYSDHLTQGEMDSLLSDDKAAIEALQDYDLHTDVALLSPIMSFSLADAGGHKSDSFDAGGLYHLVLDMGLIPDVWTPYEISKKGENALKDYKVLFISDCPVLSPQVNAALVAFVKQGGLVVGCGRVPSIDLAGAPLTERLLDQTPAEDEFAAAALGEGHVVWNGTQLGRRYWGKVRRVAVYGNTPAMNVEMPDPARTPQMRRAMRQDLTDQMAQAGYRPGVAVDLRTGGLHVAEYRKANGERLVFVVNKNPGRCYGTRLTLQGAETLDTQVRVQADWDKQLSATVQAGGGVDVPPFTSTCLLWLTPQQ